MASRQVTDREKSARSVIAAGETNAEIIQSALSQRLQPFLKPGEKVPDFACAVRLLCASLAAARDGMVAADERHEAELGDDGPVRRERDDSVAGLRAELVDLRSAIVGAYGSAAAAEVFAGPTPEDPVLLGRFAGEVADALERVKLPPSRVKGVTLAVAETAASLRDGRAQLEGSLESVQREVREGQQSLVARNRAVSAHDGVFQAVARTISGLLLQAGEAELAARVRPSEHRPGQTAEDAGEPTDPGPTADK